MKRVLAGGATVAFVGQRINFGVTALRTKNFSLAPAIFQEIAPRSGLTSRMAFVLYEIHIAFPVLIFSILALSPDGGHAARGHGDLFPLTTENFVSQWFVCHGQPNNLEQLCAADFGGA